MGIILKHVMSVNEKSRSNKVSVLYPQMKSVHFNWVNRSFLTVEGSGNYFLGGHTYPNILHELQVHLHGFVDLSDAIDGLIEEDIILAYGLIHWDLQPKVGGWFVLLFLVLDEEDMCSQFIGVIGFVTLAGLTIHESDDVVLLAGFVTHVPNDPALVEGR